MSDWTFLNKHRASYGPYASNPDYGFNGLFEFSIPGEARRIRCIASDGMGWKHVSVSFGPGSKSCPSWEIMCRIKDLFWGDSDAVIQIHPPEADYVNMHPGCLHLWQCIDGRQQPLPPSVMVGWKTPGAAVTK